ncbi:MAG: hypothetical protein AAGI53_04175 [Planctomycetota bacterium]
MKISFLISVCALGAVATGFEEPGRAVAEGSGSTVVVPAGYEVPSSAPGYLLGGPAVASELLARSASWPLVEPTLPDGPVHRARAIELYEVALQSTAGEYGGWLDGVEQARWWAALDRGGWSHPYVTSILLGSVLEERAGGLSSAEIRRRGRAAVDALLDDPEFAPLPSYRKALAARSLGDVLARANSPEDARAYRARADELFQEGLQSDRSAAERAFVLTKLSILFEQSYSHDERVGFVNGLASTPNADPYALAFLRGLMHLKRAWELRGNGFSDTVTDEGWRGFFGNMTEADRLLREAYAIDDAFYLAPQHLVRVAMALEARVGEDPKIWHASTLASTPTAWDSWEYVITAKSPRWKGSIGAMVGIVHEAAEHARRYPQVACRLDWLVAYVGDEFGSRDLAWRLPGVWPAVRNALEYALASDGEGARALHGFERYRILSTLVIGAWCNGEFELAERYYQDNSWAVSRESTDRYRLDWWQMSEVMVALGSTGRPHVLDALVFEQEGRYDDAVDAWGWAVRAGIGRPDSRGCEDELVMLHARATTLAEYHRGEWADLMYSDIAELGFGIGFSPLLIRGGSFRFEGGDLVAPRRPRYNARLFPRIPLGDRYEIEVTFEPITESGKPPAPMGGVGLAVLARFPHAETAHWTIELESVADVVNFGWRSSGSEGSMPIEASDRTAPLTLRFRREGREISAWAGSTLLHEGQRSLNTEMGDYAAIVTRPRLGDTSGARVTSFRVRRLVPRPEVERPDF